MKETHAANIANLLKPE